MLMMMNILCLIISQSRKRSHLKWFEELFIQISGDGDQPIQIDGFKAAVHTEHVSILATYQQPD